MSTYNLRGVSPASLEAGAAVTKNLLVKQGASDNTVIQTSAIADISYGVALNTAAAGEQVTVQQYGKCKVIASGAIVRGDRLMYAAGGKVAALAGATAKIVGVATMSAADGDLVEFEGCFPSVNDTQ